MPLLPLPSVPPGSDVLIDANVFIYGLLRTSRQCSDFLDRCTGEEVFGYTTVEIIGEVSHRLMVYEALSKGLISRPNAQSLRAAGQSLCGLSDYHDQTKRIIAGNFLVMTLDEDRLLGASRLRRQYPLLTNDSLLLAAADQFGVPAMASNDGDFAAVPWLSVYQPGDLP